MGMFDVLHHDGKRYQTKDLDCVLDDYRIVNGRLVHDEWHHVSVPKEQRPYPNDDGLLGMCGAIRRVVDRKDVDLNYHGTLTGCTEEGPYRRFRAKFTDGNLVEFVVDDPR